MGFTKYQKVEKVEPVKKEDITKSSSKPKLSGIKRSYIKRDS